MESVRWCCRVCSFAQCGRGHGRRTNHFQYHRIISAFRSKRFLSREIYSMIDQGRREMKFLARLQQSNIFTFIFPTITYEVSDLRRSRWIQLQQINGGRREVRNLIGNQLIINLKSLNDTWRFYHPFLAMINIDWWSQVSNTVTLECHSTIPPTTLVVDTSLAYSMLIEQQSNCECVIARHISQLLSHSCEFMCRFSCWFKPKNVFLLYG